MAKKSANPADAHRKAQRAKELKKNKENRKKVREVVTLKKDTGGYEAEIRRLAEADRRSTLTASEKEKLASLRAEVDRIQKTKDEYLEKHPEHRKFVYPNEEARLKAEKEKAEGREASGSGGPLYGKDGRLRHPERSIYYDPILNPFGAPPPGMPYRERPPSPEPLPAELQGGDEEEDSDENDSDESDSDDEIILPSGPPPLPQSSSSDSDDESDDDIIMPSGPPPPKPISHQPPLPPGPSPLPAGYPSYPPPGFDPSVPPPPFGFPPPSNGSMPFPPLPGHPNFRPPPPNGFPPNPNMQPPFRGQAFHPNQQRPPPPGFFPNQQHPNNNPNFRPPPHHQQRGGLPPNMPRGFRPPPSLQNDPLSDQPHQTYQGHQLARRPPLPNGDNSNSNPNHTPLPPKPSSSTSTPAALSAPPTTISAAPVLRDFRKESAAFVPTAVKRKAALQASKPKPITSAPAAPEENERPREVGDVVLKKKPRLDGEGGGGGGGDGGMRGGGGGGRTEPSDLMKSLGGVLGKFGGGMAKKKEDKDGYEGFLKGLDGL